jgi:DNA repair photolyase
MDASVSLRHFILGRVPRPVSNPPNPWETLHAEWLGEPPEAELEVFEEEARSIIAENESPDVGFRFSVNPYRGCFHSCAYCYARPTHQYLGWGAGTDFDRKIVAKVNAPELLRDELSRRSWRGETIVFSGVTDCYQPLEAVYELTRRCLEVCLEFRNPVGIVTKGALVRRDAEILSRLARDADAIVYVSIPFADEKAARAIEPNVAAPTQRFETIAALSTAGVPTGVGVAPVIPGLSDSDIPKILSRARAGGAERAFLTLLRLPAETRLVFEKRIAEAYPDRAARIFSNLEQMRGGKRNESRFGARMEGVGPRWAAIETLFEVECRRLGFNRQADGTPHTSTYRRPPAGPQRGLFDPD